jgi:hypothetical protein
MSIQAEDKRNYTLEEYLELEINSEDRHAVTETTGLISILNTVNGALICIDAYQNRNGAYPNGIFRIEFCNVLPIDAVIDGHALLCPSKIFSKTRAITSGFNVYCNLATVRDLLIWLKPGNS